jgi:hypothetical protein
MPTFYENTIDEMMQTRRNPLQCFSHDYLLIYLVSPTKSPVSIKKVRKRSTIFLLRYLSRPFRLKDMTTHEKIDARVYDSKLKYGPSLEERNAYNQDEARLHLKFMDDLFEEFGVTTNPKAARAFKLAWEDGYAYGLHSVYWYFSEIVELIK